MFKRLRIIGLVIAITIIVALPAMASLKFYGGDIRADIATNPIQNMVVDKNFASATQRLRSGDRIAIATTPMYGVVGENQFFSIVTPQEQWCGTVLSEIMWQRQITASNSNNDTYYKASGGQIAQQETEIGMSNVVILIGGNNANIPFESRGANSSITFNALEQSYIDQAPSSGPRMLQTSNITATVASPGEAETAPFSVVTTGDALGFIQIAGRAGTAVGQLQKFSSILANSQGLYNGITEKTIVAGASVNHEIHIGSASAAIAYYYDR